MRQRVWGLWRSRRRRGLLTPTKPHHEPRPLTNPCAVPGPPRGSCEESGTRLGPSVFVHPHPGQRGAPSADRVGLYVRLPQSSRWDRCVGPLFPTRPAAIPQPRPCSNPSRPRSPRPRPSPPFEGQPRPKTGAALAPGRLRLRPPRRPAVIERLPVGSASRDGGGGWAHVDALLARGRSGGRAPSPVGRPPAREPCSLARVEPRSPSTFRGGAGLPRPPVSLEPGGGGFWRGGSGGLVPRL